MIHHGDCLEVMAGMEPESVDAIVTEQVAEEYARIVAAVAVVEAARGLLWAGIGPNEQAQARERLHVALIAFDCTMEVA